MEGRCVAGTAPCQTSDGAHCEARCTSEDGKAQCTIVAKDADGDEHPTSLCAAAAGDDCDDHDANVHPGASELCDSRDNDCDGRVDLEDGLALDPRPFVVASGTHAAGTWAAPSFYAVAFLFEQGLYLAAVDISGVVLFETGQVPDPAIDEMTTSSPPAIGWNGTSFAIAWANAAGVHLQTFDASAYPRVRKVLSATGEEGSFGATQLVHLSDRWLSFHECCGARSTLIPRALVDSGTLLAPAAALDGPVSLHLRLATAQTELAAVWLRRDVITGASRVAWTRRDPQLVPLETERPLLAEAEAPAEVSSPVIAASSHGYAAAWTRSQGDARLLEYVELDASGRLRCGPLDLSAHFEASSRDLEPEQLLSNDHGYFLFGLTRESNDRTGGDVVQVRPGCEYVQRFELVSPRVDARLTLVGGDAQGFMLLVSDGLVQGSMYGPRFCQP